MSARYNAPIELCVVPYGECSVCSGLFVFSLSSEAMKLSTEDGSRRRRTAVSFISIGSFGSFLQQLESWFVPSTPSSSLHLMNTKQIFTTHAYRLGVGLSCFRSFRNPGNQPRARVNTMHELHFKPAQLFLSLR